MKRTIYIIVLFLCFSLAYGQDKIAVGSFTISNETFYVSNPDSNPNIFIIKTGKFSDGIPKNPDFVGNIKIESVMGSVRVYDYNTYYPYLENLPNNNSLKNNHDWINVFFMIDGNADILDLSFMVSKSTEFTPSDIAGLYKYIMENVNIRMTSVANTHRAIKFFTFVSNYDYSDTRIK